MKILSALTLAAALALPTALAAAPAMMGSSAKGEILTNAKGLSLYTFAKDKAGMSECNGVCAQNWPPLLASASDKASGEYGIIKRADGKLQWTYKGAPLYTWKGDSKAGDITGDGFKGVWHLARP